MHVSNVHDWKLWIDGSVRNAYLERLVDDEEIVYDSDFVTIRFHVASDFCPTDVDLISDIVITFIDKQWIVNSFRELWDLIPTWL